MTFSQLKISLRAMNALFGAPLKKTKLTQELKENLKQGVLVSRVITTYRHLFYNTQKMDTLCVGK